MESNVVSTDFIALFMTLLLCSLIYEESSTLSISSSPTSRSGEDDSLTIAPDLDLYFLNRAFILVKVSSVISLHLI